MEGGGNTTGISHKAIQDSLDKVRLLYSSNFQGRCLESNHANEIMNISSIKATSDGKTFHSPPHAVCIHISVRRLCFLLKPWAIPKYLRAYNIYMKHLNTRSAASNDSSTLDTAAVCSQRTSKQTEIMWLKNVNCQEVREALSTTS